jgi:hypothetical protein
MPASRRFAAAARSSSSGNPDEGAAQGLDVAVRECPPGAFQSRRRGVGVDRRLRRRRRRLVRGRHHRLDAVALQELAHFRLRQRTLERVDGAAAVDEHAERDALDLEGVGDVLLLVGVDLAEAERAVELGGQLLQHRAERTARPAPRRPEVEQHRLRHRALDDLLLERVGGDVADVGLAHAGVCRCGTACRQCRAARCRYAAATTARKSARGARRRRAARHLVPSGCRSEATSVAFGGRAIWRPCLGPATLAAAVAGATTRRDCGGRRWRPRRGR